MIARAVAVGVPFAWVTGDTVYGNAIGQRSCQLRRWLEEQSLSYVLAVKNQIFEQSAAVGGYGGWLGTGGSP